jgi:hypothetical protein
MNPERRRELRASLGEARGKIKQRKVDRLEALLALMRTTVPDAEPGVWAAAVGAVVLTLDRERIGLEIESLDNEP